VRPFGPVTARLEDSGVFLFHEPGQPPSVADESIFTRPLLIVLMLLRDLDEAVKAAPYPTTVSRGDQGWTSVVSVAGRRARLLRMKGDSHLNYHVVRYEGTGEPYHGVLDGLGYIVFSKPYSELSAGSIRQTLEEWMHANS